MTDIVERLRAGTAGLTLYEIEALWGEAATALASVAEERKPKDAKPSVAAQNDVLYQLSRITENDIPLDTWEIRSIVKAAIQEMARLRRLERSTEALKSWEAEKRKTTGDRFFIDHGQIHDRATGKHVTTDEDSVFCDGINSALELLNTLNAGATEAADAITTLRDENERMREALEKIASGEEEEYDEELRAPVIVPMDAERLSDIARAALSALPRAEADDGWRTIESAPKDGTRLLVFGGGADKVEVCAWCERVGAWDLDHTMLEDWDNQPDGYSRPSHWRPLPAPPTQAGER